MIRFAEENDRQVLMRLWQVCFEDPEAYIRYFFDNKFHPDKTLVKICDGKIVSSLYIVDYTVRMRGEDFKSGFVVGVATYPEYRNRGYAGELLKEAFVVLRQRGYRFSHLYPFRHSFYRPYGYETVSCCRNAAIGKLSESDCEYKVIDCRQEAADELGMLYNELMTGKNGFAVRTDFSRRLNEHLADGSCAAAYDENGLCGYALYSRGEDATEISECVYRDSGARKALIKFIQDKTFADRITYCANYYEQIDEAIEIKDEEYIMMRIINLADLKLKTDAEDYTSKPFMVVDNTAEWNSGVYELAANNGTARFIKTDKKPEYNISINQISKIAAGHYYQSELSECFKHILPEMKNVIYEKY